MGSKKWPTSQEAPETRPNPTIVNGPAEGSPSRDTSNKGFNKELREIRVKNMNRIIVGQLNINSLRNKFPFIADAINKNIDIFLISETKLDESFPTNQFKIEGFSTPYRLDRNRYGGGLLMYVREDIPSKLIKEEQRYEGIFVEINLKKQKWLISCSYNPNTQNINQRLHELQISLDSIATKYDRFLLLGDFNCEINQFNMPDFCESNNLKSLIQSPTCYKNPENPKCIDLMLSNYPKSFQSSYTIESGLSDFHKMTIAILKTTYKRLPPKQIKYRSFRNFSQQDFRQELNNLFTDDNLTFSPAFNEIVKILDRLAPTKTKIVRGNNAPFMNKNLRKAIMRRSKLRNLYLKNRTNTNKINYNRQRNFCVQLLRQTKKDYFENINDQRIIDNKKFWKTVKPLFSNNTNGIEKITLLEENENIIDSDEEVATILNDFFSSIVKNLNLPKPPSLDESVDNNDDATLRFISKYRRHPSIIKIKNKVQNMERFKFKNVTVQEVEKIINEMKSNKAQVEFDIPVHVIKNNVDIFAPYICKSINKSFETSSFPDVLKLGTITPVHKKGSKNEKGNYRPISILPAISKIFERIMHTQVSNYFKNIFSDFQCGFRKGYSAQTCLMLFEDLWRKAIDKGEQFAALMIDLSKAFDCISHELLIAKIHAYGLDIKATRLITDYLANRKQKTKINSQYSPWHNINTGVPQGSILGPLLFNIFICDLFGFLDGVNVVNYADDTTPFATAKSWQEIKIKLENAANSLFKWLSENQMKGNAEKSQLIVNSKNDSLFISIGNEKIFNSTNAKILGITFDNHLTFDTHIKNICKKAAQKISALARISPFMSLPKRQKLMNAFFNSQFNNCPLVWMFHSRTLNSKINRIHERCLRLVYKDHHSTFEQLLTRDGSFTFHHRNLHYLATELFKTTLGLTPKFFDELFKQKETRIINRNHSLFKSRKVKTTLHGKESLSYLGPKIWDLIPSTIKENNNLISFKREIRKWTPSACPCRVCCQYIYGIGFI